jgi:hypothetical protein
MAFKGGFMKHIHHKITLRLFAAVLVAVAVIGLSAVAAHTPTQNESSLALKSIRTDNATTFYADTRANRAWFVEMVLPTGDSKLMTENLKSVAATL